MPHSRVNVAKPPIQRQNAVEAAVKLNAFAVFVIMALWQSKMAPAMAATRKMSNRVRFEATIATCHKSLSQILN